MKKRFGKAEWKNLHNSGMHHPFPAILHRSDFAALFSAARITEQTVGIFFHAGESRKQIF